MSLSLSGSPIGLPIHCKLVTLGFLKATRFVYADIEKKDIACLQVATSRSPFSNLSTMNPIDLGQPMLFFMIGFGRSINVTETSGFVFPPNISQTNFASGGYPACSLARFFMVFLYRMCRDVRS